jgi:hypothetical protein
MAGVSSLCKRRFFSTLLIVVIAIVLSYAFSVGLLWALILVSAWPVIGTIVIGDWSNSEGAEKPPYRILFGIVFVMASLFAIALSFPEMAHFGMRDLLALL